MIANTYNRIAETSAIAATLADPRGAELADYVAGKIAGQVFTDSLDYFDTKIAEARAYLMAHRSGVVFETYREKLAEETAKL